MGIRVALTVMHLLPLQKPAVCNNLCSADFILDRNVWGGGKKKKEVIILNSLPHQGHYGSDCSTLCSCCHY